MLSNKNRRVNDDRSTTVGQEKRPFSGGAGLALRATFGAIFAGVSFFGCGGGTEATTGSTSSGMHTGGQGGQVEPPVVTTLTPNQQPLPGQTECKVVITDNVPFEGHTHQPICTAISYKSNPPASGDHWPIWAAYTTYTSPVPRELLVHDHEHGAVVMGYACGPLPCPDIPIAFEKAASDFGPDPLCVVSEGNAKRSRIIIAPDPQLAAPIGLSSWHATYVATCIDPDSLLAFIKNHYDKGSEELCAEGVDPTDPNTGIPDCTGI